ncbi:MAG: hypothetical protein RIS50_1559, partial [Bacteroidota bacterium]
LPWDAINTLPFNYQTMGPGFAGAQMQKNFRNRVLNYSIVLGQT